MLQVLRHQGTCRRYVDRWNAADTDALPGFQEVKPQVYAGIFTLMPRLRRFSRCARQTHAERRIAVLCFETSDALGFGFRCGYWHAAHGNYAGATRARVRPGSHYDSADGYLQVVKKSGDVVNVDNPSSCRIWATSRAYESRSRAAQF